MEVLQLLDFYYNSLTELSQALRNNQIDLLSFVSEISDRLDNTEPVVEAFLPEPNRRQRLIEEAELLLEEFPNPSERPPFFGIPVGIKDLFHVDGMETQGGSRLPSEALSGAQSSIVSALKKNGALILGKTTTEEFAYHGHPPTRNPHNHRHTPGGSSSGSAASVAVGSCPFAIGTQTLQSVIAPASFCGVVGFKPSYGRVPLDGVIFLSPSIDTIGFFSQTVESMEFACSNLISDWTPSVSSQKPVLGIPNGVYMTLMFDEVRRAFEEIVNALDDIKSRK